MRGRKTNVTIQDIQKEFESKGAKLLTKEYINCQQKLDFKCSRCGQVHQIAYRNYLAGRNKNLLCRDCLKSVTVKDIQKEFKKAGAVLLSETFETVDVPLRVQCRCGKEFTITWANYRAGHNRSLLCQECRRKVQEKSWREGKVKLELMDKENTGRELYEKKLEEYKKGFLYIPIYPNELNSGILRSMVGVRQGKVEKRLYARNCELVELSDGKEFLKANHIQGYRKATVTLGLEYKGELYAVMSFGKPRFNKKYEWELIRLATKCGVEVVGGASKLFKCFVERYNPKSIITYCDVRFSWPDPDRTVYKKLGFRYLYKTEPNYQYWSSNQKMHYSRMACQKHRLVDLLEDFNSELSEAENMRLNGFMKIYDCGNFVFEWVFDN